MRSLKPGRASQRVGSRVRLRRGFSLVELLVVIGVLTLLMAILLPALKRAREAARKTACASNLHQIAAAITAYSNLYSQKIPAHQTSAGPLGEFLWDVPIALTDDLMKSGLTRPIFYCPTNMDQNRDSFWVFASGWRVTGYFFFIRRLAWPAVMLDQNYLPNDPHHDAGQLYFPKLHGAHRPSESELLSDAAIAEGGNFNSVRLAGGSATNHLDGNKCQGANIAFHDGHVEWRFFSPMKRRTTAPQPDQYW